MRTLLLAPLLTGCALLAPFSTTTTMTHDGYELTCVDIPVEECLRQADETADLLAVAEESPITSMTIGRDGVVSALCTVDGCWDTE